MDVIQPIVTGYFEIAGIFGVVGLVFALALPVLLIAAIGILASALFGSSRDKEWARNEVADWWDHIWYYVRFPFVLPVALVTEGWATLKDWVQQSSK